MKNFETGIYLKLKYLAPRKRKPIPWGACEYTLEKAKEKVMVWRKENGGRFVSGSYCACSFYDVESDGKSYRMQSVPVFAPSSALTHEELSQLNEGI